MNVFEVWLNKLLDFLQFYRGPVLKFSYDISDGETQLATLTAITQDSTKLEKLYSWDFWSNDSIAITEIDSGRRVHFIPMLQWEETETEAFFIDYFKDRPRTVYLRGPYEWQYHKSTK